MRIFLGCIAALVLIFISCSQSLTQSNYSYVPEQGYVPDEKTAIKIAETLWLPVYGGDIYKEEPFVAKLKDGVWVVEGTIKTELGGALYIEIQKKDCKVLKMYHGK